MIETTAQNLCAQYNVPANDTPVEQIGDYLIARESPGEAWTSRGDVWYVNVKEPSFALACIRAGGKRAKNKFAFATVADALKASKALGHRATTIALERECTLQLHPSGVFIALSALENEALPPGFCREKNRFEKYLGSYSPPAPPSDLFPIRCVHDKKSGAFIGWFARGDNEWMRKAPSSIKTILQSKGLSKPDAEREMGAMEQMPWMKVIAPWQPIELPDRQWNLDAPQFRYKPAMGEHPTWDKVLSDLGRNLTPYLKNRTGGDYLLSWIAAAVQFPFEQTAYLALIGPENCGKSTLHEALALLFENALVHADAILAGEDNFNGEIENRIFCYVEEVDLSKSPKTHNKLKNYVTAKNFMVRRMYQNGYIATNCSHWIQCANDLNYLPKFATGDTRITVIKVDPLENKIPKPLLFQKLEEEAPAFLHTLLAYQLPKLSDRLLVPPVETDHKRRLANHNRDEFVALIEDFVTDFIGTAEQLHTFLVDKTGDSLLGFPKQFRALWNRLERNQSQLKHTWQRIDDGHKATQIKIQLPAS